MNSDDIYQRGGWWWRTMGFTKTHLLGVFITESLLGFVGFAVMVGAVTAGVTQKSWDHVVPALLVAVCIFLIQLSVLLSSILSLLFYIGSRLERATREL